MSWAHDDLIRDLRGGYDQLTPQEKMARCKNKRVEQLERYQIFDRSLTQPNGKIHFQYHKPRRRYQKRPELVERIANSRGGISFTPNIALLDAVNRADIEDVKFMMQNGADPNSADEDGLTALHQACIDNCEPIVRMLLHFGSDVDCRDSEDWTPLHACTTCGHVNIARILLEAGADLLALNADLSMPYDICEDNSPMLEFIENEMEKRNISQEQINRLRANPEMKILQEVSQKWNNSEKNPSQFYTVQVQNSSFDDETCSPRRQTRSPSNTNPNMNSLSNSPERSLSPSPARGTNPTKQQFKNKKNNKFDINEPLPNTVDDCTLLHIAAANGYLNLCRKLLYDWNATPDGKDKDGWTACHASCCWSQRETLQMLVEKGADVNLRNRMGEKAAEVTDDQEVIGFLNHLVREQRQRRRQRELQDAQAQRDALAAKAASANTSTPNPQQTFNSNTHTSFNRTQSSRKSARSQSFRRRSIRKNKDNTITSNSGTNLENNQKDNSNNADNGENTAAPHVAEAKLEAAFWRGEVTGSGGGHGQGESSSSSGLDTACKVTCKVETGQNRGKNSKPMSPKNSRVGDLKDSGGRQPQRSNSSADKQTAAARLNGNVDRREVTSPVRAQQISFNIPDGGTSRRVQSPITQNFNASNANSPSPVSRPNKNSGCCTLQ